MDMFMMRQAPSHAHQEPNDVFGAILNDIEDARALVKSCLTLIRDEKTTDDLLQRFLFLAWLIVYHCPEKAFDKIQDVSSVDDLWAALLRAGLRAYEIGAILYWHGHNMNFMQEEEEYMRRDTVRRLVATGRRCIGPTLAALYSCNPRSNEAQQIKADMIEAWEDYRRKLGLSQVDKWTEQDEAEDWEEGGHKEDCQRWRKSQE
ncbi:hypothetical protein EIP86_007738 [Pleurotus ostreatoroseus]|nr:hypothetical protein EIP86_007738 [Pleurotus ostreatoroseus]